MTQSALQQSYLRFIDGKANEQDKQNLLAYFNIADTEELELLIAEGSLDLADDDRFADQPLRQQKLAALYSGIEARIDAPIPIRRSRFWGVIALVASLFAVGFITLFVWKYRVTKFAERELTRVLPGTNRAILELADGHAINLDESKNAITMQNGQVVYNNGVAALPTNTRSGLYTLRTPRSGQYQLILSDGTKVWLNAASSITYPSHFDGKARNVTASGEVYFEVSKDKEHPFIVKTDSQVIQVLGTKFNLQAYDDTKYVRTTLLEGSVKISTTKSEIFLKPGQESMLKDGEGTPHIQPATADVAAWTEGIFSFHNTPLKEVLQNMSRWYNVEVDYGNLPDRKVDGEIPRTISLAEALHQVGGTIGLKFKMNDNRITVIK